MLVAVASIRKIGVPGRSLNAESLEQSEVPEIEAGRLDRAALGRAEAADRRGPEGADVEPAIDGRIRQLRIAQLVGTDRDDRPGGRRRESGPGWIRHRDRRRQEVARLQVADHRDLPAAERKVDERRRGAHPPLPASKRQLVDHGRRQPMQGRGGITPAFAREIERVLDRIRPLDRFGRVFRGGVGDLEEQSCREPALASNVTP